ncbi:carbohydrate kinase family protein [Raoultella planticola]|uniref:carbohydrate kinase family protein n=1 Tax=Raoultella planticola TaxID=575 RepID=UPI0007EC062B|nr:carbohydrate kinase family protein [Raoultella planticola]MDY7622225.1 carbohydrate kinase family protein [Raoultella planticola]OAZ86181.1 ribokinase [Raoultella planticola]OAZ86511.1 ribokinase [Raoultella planticola]
MQTLTAPVLYIAGNYNIDLVMGTLAQWPTPGTEVMLEHSALRPGGSAGNCALAAAAMQLPHCTVGCQGDDAFTAWLAAQFPGSAERWPQYPCETSLTVAVTHPDKERSFLSNYGHITRLSADDILTQLPARATPGDILLLCGTFLCTALLPDYPRLLTTLRDRGFQVAVDTGWPPHNWDSALREATHRWLGDCDWLLLNEVETLGLANQAPLPTAARALAARLSGRGGCIVKCGADGAWWWTAEQGHHAPVKPVEVIDTIGAGDSFNAGFLAGLLNGQSASQALRWGNAVAAYAIGSSPRRYPDWRTLQHHIEEVDYGQR